MSETLTVLIVEDGDEYQDSLGRFVPGPRYLQARSGAAALARLAAEPVDLIYLDMRFDRTPREALLGDHAALVAQHNGNAAAAWRHLENHQGLYILDALARAGHRLPVVLSYDFSREPARFTRLAARYPALRWVPDAVTPEQIRGIFATLQG
jgi:hypothetical protein